VASSPRRAGAADVFRTLLALAAIAPGLVAGLATWLLTRDRRRARNRAFALWGDLGTRAAGIRLEVRGTEHLRVRPAVFVLNHQSGVDPILVCALLRRDFVAVAKREIRRNPVLGPAFAFAGVVFVDRFDHDRALHALEPAVRVLRSGTALALAPEGTRSRGETLGRFKKGAFRLAMAAGAPLVPIVIHDSARVLPRGSWIMRAGTVRVTVLPPVPTREWTLEGLDGEIAALEARYRGTLEGREAAASTLSSAPAPPAPRR
jgi:putative phosphoserine phosphatase/1-acylglycerol-3-phosphate O-acyltransferase